MTPWEPVGLETDLLRRWESGPFFLAFSLRSSTTRLKIVKNCPHSPSRLATIAQVRQAPGISLLIRTLTDSREP